MTTGLPPPDCRGAEDRQPSSPLLSRRGFLLGAGAVGAAALAGTLGLSRPWDRPSGAAEAATTAPGRGGPLVVITLYGGNDGLNTVVPYADPAYRSARPSLGYTPSEILALDDELGLNPKLPGLRSLWQSKQLAIVRGVGYLNPNLSHFASMDIWQTANPADGAGPGWLGRWLDATGDDPMRAISVGTTLPPLLRGDRAAATALTATRVTLPGSADFESAFASLQGAGPDRIGLSALVAQSGQDLLAVKGQLDGLRTEAGTTGSGAGAAAPTRPSPTSESDLAGQLDIVAALINAGAPTSVYQVSLSSFDTHAGEKANHERLLAELDGAVTGFLKAVAATPTGRKAVVMTFSEFGRRPAENASGGTDHGAAAPLFVAGLEVKGGQFYGDQPSLTRLDADGNQLYNVDFRSVYATVLERVVGVDSAPLLGGRFSTLPFV